MSQELGLYHLCAGATSMDQLRGYGGDQGLRPVYATWDGDGRLLEVQFASSYSGNLAAKYTYER